jgi:MIP family channel proteins
VASDILRKAVAEFIGTFALVFLGAGAIVATGGTDLLLVALAHGLTIAVMVSATAHISGGHFNPAVTLGAIVGRQMTVRVALAYWIAQLLAALVASAFLVAIFPAAAGPPVRLGTPAVAPSVSVLAAILVEAVLTFFLVIVVFGTGIDPKGAFHAVGGFAIGATIAVDIMMGGPLTGAAMNPARWFGPAVFANAFDLWYVYWVGPFAGGVVAGLLYSRVLMERAREA